MENKTDIELLRSTAYLLLDMKVSTMDVPSVKGMGDFFVSHPIFRDRHVIKPVEKTEENPVGLVMLDVLVPEEREEAKRLYMDAIDKCTKVSDFFLIINKPYLGIFFKIVKNWLNKEDYTNMLTTLWTTMEFPNTDTNVSTREWVKFWKEADLYSYVYDKEDLDFIEALPDTFLVYRGLMERASTKALSWTLDINKAVWFAKRFNNKKGKVYKALCHKKDILAYLSNRGESEIVVDWKKLENIEEISYV